MIGHVISCISCDYTLACFVYNNRGHTNLRMWVLRTLVSVTLVQNQRRFARVETHECLFAAANNLKGEHQEVGFNLTKQPCPLQLPYSRKLSRPITFAIFAIF